MTPAQAHAYLAGLSPSKVVLGLDRIREALAKVGEPQRRFPALHVAGTNGKGSTVAFLAACLGRRYRVGRYTSPHLERYNERIQVAGQDIADEALAALLEDTLGLLGPHQLTYFELGTVLAFRHFAEQAVDVAVVETGLGGRLDATTACEPLVTAVTQIGFDHMEFLGDTLPAIAAEKAGIVKPQVPLVLAAQAPEVLPVFEKAARSAQARLLREGLDFELAAEPGGGLHYAGPRSQRRGLTLGLQGQHQLHNAAVALAVLDEASARGLPLDEASVRQGLASTRWPGRLELFEGTPPVLLDAAHNPAGVEALLCALEQEHPGRPVELVFAVLGDKDWRSMIARLWPRVEGVHLAPLASPRALPQDELLRAAERAGRWARAHGSSAEALLGARQRAGEAGLVLVCGSLVLLGQVRPLLAAGPGAPGHAG